MGGMLVMGEWFWMGGLIPISGLCIHIFKYPGKNTILDFTQIKSNELVVLSKLTEFTIVIRIKNNEDFCRIIWVAIIFPETFLVELWKGARVTGKKNWSGKITYNQIQLQQCCLSNLRSQIPDLPDILD